MIRTQNPLPLPPPSACTFCCFFFFRDPWISLECQLNNGSVRKYLGWAGLNLCACTYISNWRIRNTRAHENWCADTGCAYTRPSTCPSRRTTLNLPWIRARTERGRTGQFSIQVGQSRSSACTRLTLIFPISSSSFFLIGIRTELHSSRARGLEVKSFIGSKIRKSDTRNGGGNRLLYFCRVKLFSLVPFFPKMESMRFA